jgi:leader peptidase (prepilin peptidase) / N-methyltransferase
MTWAPDPLVQLFLAGVLGLLVGSFLNVVVHRWPQMLLREWALEMSSTTDVTALARPGPVTPAPRFDLSFPGSHCPDCVHALRWYENVPLLSFLAQGGKCRACKTRISWQYPVVELVTACLFVGVLDHWGLGLTALSWGAFVLALGVLALVDAQTQLLPDQGTLGLLWLGLLVALVQGTGRVSVEDAVIGAMVGYLMPWCVAKAFCKLTGREGMGHGDFKLLAAMGAWLGWMVVPGIFLLASVLGAVVGLCLRTGDRPMPFGPFLCTAALVAWWTPQALLMH